MNAFSRAFGSDAVQHFVEHVLDQVVLSFEKRDDVIGGLNKCFNHGNNLRCSSGWEWALWAVRHQTPTRRLAGLTLQLRLQPHVDRLGQQLGYVTTKRRHLFGQRR